MKEYLFRGKGRITREWHYGCLLTIERQNMSNGEIEHKPFIFPIEEGGTSYEVIPETVGQWTGEVDVNEVKIFEGDLLEVEMEGDLQESPYAVDSARIFYLDVKTPDNYMRINKSKIIGNVHDNPELMEEK